MRLTSIKLRHIERGLLQIHLARRTRIARCRLSEIENGHVQARHGELKRLAAALRVSVEALHGEEGKAQQ